MKRLLIAALLLASCAESSSPDIVVTDAWARETVPGQSTTAAYMTVANRGTLSDRLESISATPPAMAMIHQTSSANGTTQMREATGVEIPADKVVRLKPLGAHVMVSGLQIPLRHGDVLPLTLHFDRSGAREVKVQVLGATKSPVR